MANTCSTTLNICGEAENIKRLADDLEKITSERYSTWVGEHLKLFGYDADKISRDVFNLRASILDVDSSENCISINLECAWSPCYHYMSFLTDKYDVEVGYIADEPGCCVYLTSDINSVFPYILEICKDDFYTCYEEFNTAEERDKFIEDNGLTEDDYYADEYDEYTDWYETINYDELPKLKAA